ncbi:SGNH/GDSL hydrolase family protein [Nocardioidaceae bacterium]|nr:SGNH/GDSL hydrolase family protein [Nocardioidaceae bacterium]
MTSEPSSVVPLAYDNRTGRGPGRTVRTLRWVLPGVRRVWGQVGPYADAWSVRNADELARPGRRLIVLGDSMAQAVGASAYDAGWVDRVVGDLRGVGADPRLVNLSATGARVPDLLEQQVPVMHRLPDPVTGDPVGVRSGDVVVVLIGSNDLYAGREHRDRLPSAFAEMLEALPHGSVVSTLIQPHGEAGQVNAMLRSAAREGAVTLVDMGRDGPGSWVGKTAADFFHPNDRGYSAIAEAFAPQVLRAWEAAAPG